MELCHKGYIMSDTPYDVLNNNMTQLKQYYRSQVEELKRRRPSKEQWNSTIAGWKSDFGQQKFRIDSLRTQLDDIQSTVKDQTLANEAMWRLVVPPEQAAAMFPKPVTVKEEPRGRFTPGEFKTYKDEFARQIGTAVKGGLWGFSTDVDTDKLKELYFSNREVLGYDNQMNTDEKKAFDRAWDVGALQAGKKFNAAWINSKNTDPDLFASRTYDNRMLDVAAKKVSPLAASIRKQRKTWGWPTLTKPGYRDRTGEGVQSSGPKTLDKETARVLLSEVGGDKDKARELARQRGYQF